MSVAAPLNVRLVLSPRRSPSACRACSRPADRAGRRPAARGSPSRASARGRPPSSRSRGSGRRPRSSSSQLPSTDFRSPSSCSQRIAARARRSEKRRVEFSVRTLPSVSVSHQHLVAVAVALEALGDLDLGLPARRALDVGGDLEDLRDRRLDLGAALDPRSPSAPAYPAPPAGSSRSASRFMPRSRAAFAGALAVGRAVLRAA